MSPWSSPTCGDYKISLRARKIAENYLQESLSPPKCDQYVIVDAGIGEANGGWYLPYQTRRFVETGDIDHSVVGNWPIFVSKDGSCDGGRRPA